MDRLLKFYESEMDGYQIMTYKNRQDNFKRLFKDTEVATSTLLSDFICAIHAGSPKILQQGRMYITVDFVCFYCRILTYEQKIFININDIVDVTKEKTALVFPNAIQISTKSEERYFFASFTSRDRTFHIINKLWTEHKIGLKISSPLMWDRIRISYGNDLGFAVSDPEYEASNSTQFIARYVKRPSETLDSSSQDDSLYESLSDSHSNDSKDELSSSINSKELKINVCDNNMKLITEDEIKFDLLFCKKPLNESLTKMEYIDEIVPPVIEVQLEPATCSGHDHFVNITMDEEFNINVTTLWTYLFTDNAFFRALSAMRMIVDIKQSHWSSDIDTNNGASRTILYTVNLKNKIGPKKSPTVEKQVRLPGSQDNYIYLIESTVRTVGITLSDSFHVVILYCILYVNPTRSRLKMSMKVVYDKSVFFATKSIIESTVRSSCLDYNKDLKSSLINESNKIFANPSVEKVHQSPISIEESYSDPIIDPCIETSIFKEATSCSEKTNISWMVMVLICCIAFLLLYIVKEMFSDRVESPILTSFHYQHAYDQLSLNEIMELIKEMKSVIEVLKQNVELLKVSNYCDRTNTLN